MGGWLTHGDLALDSCAQFLAVAEHWLSLSGLGQFVISSVRLAGVGVVSLAGAPLALPSFSTGGG